MSKGQYLGTLRVTGYTAFHPNCRLSDIFYETLDVRNAGLEKHKGRHFEDVSSINDEFSHLTTLDLVARLRLPLTHVQLKN